MSVIACIHRDFVFQPSPIIIAITVIITTITAVTITSHPPSQVNHFFDNYEIVVTDIHLQVVDSFDTGELRASAGG